MDSYAARALSEQELLCRRGMCPNAKLELLDRIDFNLFKSSKAHLSKLYSRCLNRMFVRRSLATIPI